MEVHLITDSDIASYSLICYSITFWHLQKFVVSVGHMIHIFMIM